MSSYCGKDCSSCSRYCDGHDCKNGCAFANNCIVRDSDEIENEKREITETNHSIGKILKIIAFIAIARVLIGLAPLCGSLLRVFADIALIVFYFIISKYNKKFKTAGFLFIGDAVFAIISVIVVVGSMLIFRDSFAETTEFVLLAVITGIAGVLEIFATYLLYTGYSELVGKVNVWLQNNWLSLRKWYIVFGILSVISSSISLIVLKDTSNTIFTYLFGLPLGVIVIIHAVYLFKSSDALTQS